MERRDHPSQRRRSATNHSGTRRTRSHSGPRTSRGTRKVYKPALRVGLAPVHRRLKTAMIMVVVAMLACGARLFHLQAFDTNAYAAKAANRVQRQVTLPAKRGTITDRNGAVLAQSELAVHVKCDPTQIKEVSKLRKRDVVPELADALVQHLGGNKNNYMELMRTPDSHNVYLIKSVQAFKYRQMAEELQDKKLYGIYRENAPRRTYPAGPLAGNVVGFVDGEGAGKAGLEYYLNDQLKGQDGWESYELGAWGRMPLSNDVFTPTADGVSYQLTLDSNIQATVELSLGQSVRQYAADWGAAIAMNIKTGEIYALAQAPGYDPSNYGSADPKAMTNYVTSNVYEPGSVHKLITMAALTDAGLITPDTQITVPDSVQSGAYKITDEHPNGHQLTARGILSRSSNIGTTLLARNMPKDQYLQYLHKFGFGSKTGVEVPGESSGLVDDNMTEAMRDRAAFGQSTAVTVVQEAAALAGIFNAGIYNPPTILKAAHKDGKPLALPKKEAPKRIISPQSSAMVLDMAENVVTVASQGSLAIPNFRLGGKTGTAERVDPTCGCYRGFVASYVGIGPIEDPSVMVYMVVSNPHGANMGAVVAAPFVRDLLRMILPYYGVPMSVQPPRKGTEEW